MTVTITITGEQPLADQLLDTIKCFLDQEAEDQAEYENTNGEVTAIEKVWTDGPQRLKVKLALVAEE